MIVERQRDEILVRIPATMKTSRLQAILDYLRYEELTSQSTASADNVDMILREANKGRWGQVKKEIGLND